jgi:hypothetical protein
MYDISILVDTHSTKQREKQWQHEWGYMTNYYLENIKTHIINQCIWKRHWYIKNKK